MFAEKEIIKMSPEEFSKNWKNNHIQDSLLKLLGARRMTPEDKEYINTHKEKHVC